MPRSVFLLLVALAVAPPAFAFRCGSNLVTGQMQDFQVRDRCGDPFFTDSEVSLHVVGAYSPIEYQQAVQFDIWYYNFGPRQFMRKLVFRDGVLIGDERLGYGFDEVGDNCNTNGFFDNLTAGELYARCGEPASRRSQGGTIVRRPAPGIEHLRDDRREQWIYDFGDSRFVRVVDIDNGRVTGSASVPR